MRSGYVRLALVCSVYSACAESPIAEETENSGESATAADGAVLDVLDAASAVAPLDAVVPSKPGDPSGSDAQIAADARTEPSDARVAPLDARAADDANVTTVDAAVRDAAMRDAAAPRDAAPPPMEASAPMCMAPQRSCENRCVDTRSDVANCGACDKRCAGGESCIESRCWPAPPQGCTAKTFESRVYLFCNQERTWREARQSCLGARMDLVSIANAAENEFLRGVGAVCWIGANDLQTERTWTWTPAGVADRPNGPAVMYANWIPNEPNNTTRCDGLEFLGDRCLGRQSDEDCGELSADGRWNDSDCELQHRYICESY